ncbi:DUF4055 domain-containing protein [Gilliamella sp. Pra-s65]|uniref:DUF4055 domain-containing protein n=1 Tax=unclassified Gilliamella TaxID=2685620 RepID=UPI001365A9DB|nr:MULTISPECIES: DUF4055 domain-containing protein [unclassified Gilliamella]MWN91274.1 DUF4055 domain-containing protein [Gilliamella sp. Pra-s65]MWP74250.1 DUF4055 domain-containing protein [Gilliamella sp. Pra-s52]
MNHDITFIRPEHKQASINWEKMRDVCAGAEIIKSKGNQYLPYLDPTDKSERNKKRNQDYIARAVFYSITGHTKIGLIGMAFRKDPTISIPNKLEYLKTNADGAGTSIYQQSQSTLESVLEVGRHGLYVDYSSDSNEAMILSYKAEDIINWRTQRINGKDKLVLVVLREVVEVSDGYGFKDITQYRELAIDDGKFICKVWRRTGENNSGPYEIDSIYEPKPKNEDHWHEIPFTFVGAQNNDPTIDDSPLSSLVEINLGHYRNSADYEDSLFFCGQVQPAIIGLDTEWRDFLEKNGVKIGSRTPLLLPQGGNFVYAQAQPNTLAKEGMDDKRNYMVALGARLIEQNSSAKTATQANGDQTASTSVLGICCSNVSEAYTIALKWCAHYLGIVVDDIVCSINQEFISKIADAGMITAIVSSWQSGAIRDEDMIRAMQKLDIIDPSADPETVKQELKDAAPQLLGNL